MKSSTWIVVVLALAVTGSMVVAKSFFASPEQADASAQMAGALMPATLQTQQGGPLTVGGAVALSAPSRTALAAPPAPFLVKQAPIISSPAGDKKSPRGWSVLVVRGDDEENITYQNADVQSPTP